MGVATSFRHSRPVETAHTRAYHLLGPGSGRYVIRQLDIAGVFASIVTSFTLELYIGHMRVPVEIVLGVKASQERER